MITKVTCFYNDLTTIGPTRIDDNRELVKLWKTNWEANGWCTKIVSLSDALRHEYHSAILNTSSNLYTNSSNTADFLKLCYARWLAYDLESPTLWADYDVMNYGVTPSDLSDISNSDDPVYFSPTGCIGYTGNSLSSIIDTYVEIAKDSNIGITYLSRVISRFNEVSDMTITAEINNDKCLCITNPFFSIDYNGDNDCSTAKFVHFHHGYTTIPRTEFIKKTRNPL